MVTRVTWLVTADQQMYFADNTLVYPQQLLNVLGMIPVVRVRALNRWRYTP